MNRETLIEIAGWVVTVVAVGGVILNNRRRRECFWLWFISNTISAGIHASAGMVALTVRDLVFLVLAVQGLVLWTRAARRGEPAGKIEIRVTVTDRLTRALRRTIAILRKASPEAVVKCGACGEPVCIDPAEGVFHVIQCPACGATGEYDEYAEPAASERRSTVNAKRWWLGERWLWMWRESCGLIGPRHLGDAFDERGGRDRTLKLIIPLNWLVGWAVALWWRLQMLAPGVMASWQSVHWWTLWKDEGMRREKMEYAAKRDAAIYEKQIEDLQRGAEGIIAERDEALRRLAETKAAP